MKCNWIKGFRAYGIQRRYLRYTLSLLLLTMLLSSIGTGIFVRNSLGDAVIEKYGFLGEKMGLALDSLYTKSDEVLAECILRDDVQKSLQVQGVQESERKALSKYFAYVDFPHIQEYIYVDNKGYTYTRSYSRVSREQFLRSGFAELLGEEYAKTKWLWTEDTLFGMDEPSLFIGRYVRSMNYSHEPGMIYFKMNDDFWDEMLGSGVDQEIVVGLVDGEGRLCRTWYDKNYNLTDRVEEQVIELIVGEGDKSGMNVSGAKIPGGVLSSYRQKESGFSVFIIVPDEVLMQGLGRMMMIMLGIFLVVIAIAVNVSIYFSKRFTRPITQISNAMTHFDGNDFSRLPELHTNTELDQMGDSYNKMLGNIEQLLLEVKLQEKELRVSEMNTLLNQINPHFLYNTLDTIYMLARINKEETTMKMIQALSKYLRVTLSKGNAMIPLEDEIENAKSYMQIQQIRNSDLFHYEIDCRVDPQKKILKMILQPLVENAIKYGFCEIYSGGLIRIEIWEEEGRLIIQVFNNGKPIDSDIAEKFRGVNHKELLQIKKIFEGTEHGYGVINIMTRLRLKYGDDVSINYEALEEGTMCRIEIPGGELQDEEE